MYCLLGKTVQNLNIVEDLGTMLVMCCYVQSGKMNLPCFPQRKSPSTERVKRPKLDTVHAKG